MLESIGNEAQVIDIGLKSIGYTPTKLDIIRHKIPINGLVKTISKFIFNCCVRKAIEDSDCVIIVAPVPGIFLNKKMFIEDFLRTNFPTKPIVAFITEHLLTLGHWYEALSGGSSMLSKLGKQRHHLLERFDWYLCVSQSGLRKKPQADIPLTQIGINFDDGSLFPEQNNDFLALIDFKRSRYNKHLKMQLSAIKRTNTKYLILEGKYTIDEIRAIYRKTSVYFIAHLESFGYPIVELQACGAYIATPYDFWCCGHFRDLIYDDFSITEHLTANFLTYDADEDFLCELLIYAKKNFDPLRNRKNFMENYNLFFYGDIEALKQFVSKLENKSISSTSHKKYDGIFPESIHVDVIDKLDFK